MTYRNGFCVLSKLEALSVLAVLDKRCTRHENSTLKGGILKDRPATECNVERAMLSFTPYSCHQTLGMEAGPNAR